MWSQVPDEWVGPAEALDGTTLIINGLPLHLAGIEAVDDLCYSRNNVLSCGNAAREHLAHLIKDKRVICSGTDTDWYRLPRVYCSADDVNLSRQMVGGGWAKADKSGAYRAEQDLARNRQIGFWQYDPYPSQK